MAKAVSAFVAVLGDEIIVDGVGPNVSEAKVNLDSVGSFSEEEMSSASFVPCKVSLEVDPADFRKKRSGAFALVDNNKIFVSGIASTAGNVSRAAACLELTPLQRGSYDILPCVVVLEGAQTSKSTLSAEQVSEQAAHECYKSNW